MQDETIERTTVTQSPAGNLQTQTVTQSRSPIADFFVSKVNQVIFTIVGIIDLLLLLRVVFLMLGANRVGVVDFIINVTDIFVAPFRGIFASPSSGDSYFDVAAVLAMLMFIVLGVILGVIVDLFSSKTE